ncbi:MAG TPA: shikimate dehydrogenase [Longimicrobium sp.]|nr:shikimate dehydrogenase [Longimicrobium sp.]
MTDPVAASTRVIALLGDPVSHSLSPRIQNAAIRALLLDGVYVALRCAGGDLPWVLRALAHAGGGGNVTVPHKEAAFRAVDRRTAAAEATGAVNTFWLAEGEVWGDNTDVEGFTAAVRVLLGRSAAGARVLLLGAGGAARAVVHALASHGAERIVIVNRTGERARELAHRFGRGRTQIEVVASAGELGAASFDLAVNTTSLGLHADDPLPLDPLAAPEIDAALDLVYDRSGETRWVRAMNAHGIPTADGTEMLLQQGAAAFRRWWSLDPPLEVMRAALREN